MKTFAPYLRVLAGMFAGICLWLAFAEVVNGNIAQAVTQLLFAAGLGYLAAAKPIRDHQARVKAERNALAARADAENAEFLAGDPAAFAPPPEEPEKPKMRRGVVTATVIAGAVVFIGVINDIATGVHDPSDTSKTSQTATLSAPTAGVAAPPMPSQTQGTASAAAAAPNAAGIGQEVRDGDFAFVVNSVERTPLIQGTARPHAVSHASGEYIVVHMTVSNTTSADPHRYPADQSRRFSSDEQKLETGGQTFLPDGGVAVDLGSAVVYLAPGEKIDVALPYDVPRGTPPGVLEVHDSYSSNGAEINLQ